MDQKKYLTYALVAGALAIGAIWAGVPASIVLVVGLLLACPLMMLFMHGGHGNHGGGGGHDHGQPEARERPDATWPGSGGR